MDSDSEDGMGDLHGDLFGYNTSDNHNMEENSNVIGSHESEAIHDMFSNLGAENEALDEYWKIVQMTFESEEDSYNFYNAYAKKKGFSVRKDIVRHEKKIGEIFYRRFVCSKEGIRDEGPKPRLCGRCRKPGHDIRTCPDAMQQQ